MDGFPDPPSSNQAFEHLSLTILKQGPVTVRALVKRPSAKQRPPTLSQDFARHSLHYEWKTGLGTTVGVSESIGSTDRIFSASLGRS